MPATSQRKTIFLLALAVSLIVALVAIVTDDELRDRLGLKYYVLSLSIIGCVLLVLAGYVWDRTLLRRLNSLRTTVVPDGERTASEHDEIIGLAKNIERMAQALQRSEASYRGIVEDQIDLICRYRADGTLTFVNRAYADVFGRKRTELLGQPFVLRTPPVPRDGEPQAVEREIDYADGRHRWLLWTVRAIRDRDGGLLECQAVGHDITVRKEAEAAVLQAKEAAVAADRAKTEFLAIVSHEIRTPINGVIGFAQILAETPLSAEQRESVAIIKSSAQALEKLIADILDLSKIEAGKIGIESAPFGLRKCVEDVAAFFAPRARAAALVLNVAIDPDVPAIVNSDENRLRQILTNLIGNALKFTERGSVTIRVSCARGEAELAGDTRRPLRIFFSIADTGIGIAAEKLGQLFKAFSQVDVSPDRRRTGTGLGLIICKRLCELMGGSISVESQPGQGTTFHFSILADYQKGDTAPPFGPGAVMAPRPS